MLRFDPFGMAIRNGDFIEAIEELGRGEANDANGRVQQ